MFIPEPLIALIVSYHTDGQPVRRILAGAGRLRTDDSGVAQVVDMVAYKASREARGCCHKSVALEVKQCAGRKEAMWNAAFRGHSTWRRPSVVQGPVCGIADIHYISYLYDDYNVGVRVFYPSETEMDGCVALISEVSGKWQVYWLEDEHHSGTVRRYRLITNDA